MTPFRDMTTDELIAAHQHWCHVADEALRVVEAMNADVLRRRAEVELIQRGESPAYPWRSRAARPTA